MLSAIRGARVHIASALAAATALRHRAADRPRSRALDIGEDEDDWAQPGDERLVTSCQDCIAQTSSDGVAPTSCGGERQSRECWQRRAYRSVVAGQVPIELHSRGRCVVCGQTTHWTGSPHGPHEAPWLYCSDACYERRPAQFRTGDDADRAPQGKPAGEDAAR